MNIVDSYKIWVKDIREGDICMVLPLSRIPLYLIADDQLRISSFVPSIKWFQRNAGLSFIAEGLSRYDDTVQVRGIDGDKNKHEHLTINKACLIKVY